MNNCNKQNEKIELIDEKIVAPVIDALKADKEEFSILIMPDHPTPLAIRTHTSDPVPYIIYKSGSCAQAKNISYTEAEARKTGIVVEHGYTLMERLLQK